jgi:hypothetical protein
MGGFHLKPMMQSVLSNQQAAPLNPATMTAITKLGEQGNKTQDEQTTNVVSL